MKKQKTLLIAECGIMVALATVLSFIKIYEAPYGGSATLMSMLPIMLVSFRRGVKCGLVSGFVYSVIQLIFGLSNVAWVPSASGIVICVLFDYIIPFTLIGLAGLFSNCVFTRNERVNKLLTVLVGAVTVMLVRYLCHIVSGVVVWYALDLVWYADDPGHIVNRYGPWTFSAIYNGTFMIWEIAVTAIGAAACALTPSVMNNKR